MTERRITQPKMIGREMPYSLEAEVALLGSIFLRPTSIERIIDIIRPGDFYRSAHRAIYKAMVRLYNERDAIDVVTVTTELEKRGQLESAGGVEFLSELSEAVPTSHNIKTYAKIVHKKAIMRNLLETTWGIIDEGYAPSSDPDEVLEKAVKSFVDIRSQNFIGRSEILWYQDLQDGPIARAMDEIEKNQKGESANVLTTGFPEFDKVFDGIGRGEYIICCARPSMGKTSFLLQLLEMIAAKHNAPSIFISCETRVEKLGIRSLLSSSEIDRQDMRRHYDEVSQALSGAAARLSELPVGIVDKAIVTVEMLKQYIYEALEKHPNLFAVAIDYVQLVRVPGHMQRASGNEKYEYISQSLRAIVNEFNIALLCAAQLNREIEKEPIYKRRPALHHLRGSGTFEQDADKIFGIWRKEYYQLKEREIVDPEYAGMAEFVGLKHKDGDPTGDFKLIFHAAQTRFESPRLAYAPRESPQRDMFNEKDSPF